LAQDTAIMNRRSDGATEGDKTYRPESCRDRDGRPQALSDCQNEAPIFAQNDKISDVFLSSTDVHPSQYPCLRPFLDFKRFIDNQLAFLANDFVRFPENLDMIRNRIQREQECLIAKERDISRRWTGSDDSPDQIHMRCERHSPETREVADQVTIKMFEKAAQHHASTPLGRILALFHDDVGTYGELDEFANPMLSFAGAWYYRPEHENENPLTGSTFWRITHQPQWLSMEWFKRSDYSPIRLEAHPDLENSGAKWRAAFEDLLCVSLGKPMDAKKNYALQLQTSKYPNPTLLGPGMRWLADLQGRGVLPPLLPRTYSSFQARNMRTLDEVMRLVHESRADIPLGSDHAFLSCSETEQDLSDMISEFVVDPVQARELRKNGTDAETWTELDMYDRLSSSSSSVWSSHVSKHAESTVDSDNQHCRGDGARRTAHDAEGSEDDLFKILTNVMSQEVNYHTRTHTSAAHGGLHSEDADDWESDHGNADNEEEPTSSAGAIKPNVLSTLTTTETIRLPDGTVTTKVVLKQRFADGREETSERSHTYREESEAREEKASKKGWFWA
jgi:hypothetical protein